MMSHHDGVYHGTCKPDNGREYNEEVFFSESWRIALTPSWKLKDGLILKIECEACKGEGGGMTSGIMSMDGPEPWDCDACNGRGFHYNDDIERIPQRIPLSYMKHMRKAHLEFFESKENRRYL